MSIRLSLFVRLWRPLASILGRPLPTQPARHRMSLWEDEPLRPALRQREPILAKARPKAPSRSKRKAVAFADHALVVGPDGSSAYEVV